MSLNWRLKSDELAKSLKAGGRASALKAPGLVQEPSRLGQCGMQSRDALCVSNVARSGFVAWRIGCLMMLAAMLAAGLQGCGGSVRSSMCPPPSAAVPPGAPKPYKALGKWYQPLPNARGYHEKGIASWYGYDFHGKKTSSGEIYDMYAETAAHKTLPLGTIVRVRNLKNNHQIDVRINDRGPFVSGRIIDLSYACACKLGVVGPGTAPVEVVAIGTTAPPAAGTDMRDYYYRGNFTIQVGAFSDLKNAERLKMRLARAYQNVHIQPYDDVRGRMYRVRVSSSTSLDKAVQYEKILISRGYRDAFAVAE